uniref:Uncharacterized protein n=1 Tax=Quercus lobata TaxID=97700 RepID=A0A7N2QZG3_QUELO
MRLEWPWGGMELRSCPNYDDLSFLGSFIITIDTRVPHYSQYPNPMLSITSKVQACGSMVTEEQPHAMLIPMEFFLMGYGLYRPSYFSDSPRSPLSPSCISPELLSPESMGLKVKTNKDPCFPRGLKQE